MVGLKKERSLFNVSLVERISNNAIIYIIMKIGTRDQLYIFIINRLIKTIQ